MSQGIETEEDYVTELIDSLFHLEPRNEDPAEQQLFYWQVRAELETARQLAIQNDRNERIAAAAGLAAEFENVATHDPTIALEMLEALKVARYIIRRCSLILDSVHVRRLSTSPHVAAADENSPEMQMINAIIARAELLKENSK